MSEEKYVKDVVEEWKNTCFFDYQLTFAEAAKSLSAETDRLVELRVGTGAKASTWTVFNKKTGEEAIMVHAAVWHSNTDLITGNFVPDGETAPNSVPDGRLQTEAGYKCDISYTLDTSVDESFYEHIEASSCSLAFENYAKTLSSFNRSKRPRARWQNGARRKAYTITSKLFVRRTTNPRKPDFEPHEWLQRGVANQSVPEYVINPDRPFYFALVDDAAVQLEDADPPHLQQGDVVWFAFKMSFFVGREYWSSEIIPVEFMRIACVQDLLTSDKGDSGGEEEDGNARNGNGGSLRAGRTLVPITRGRDLASEEGAEKSKGDHSDSDTLDSEGSSGTPPSAKEGEDSAAAVVGEASEAHVDGAEKSNDRSEGRRGTKRKSPDSTEGPDADVSAGRGSSMVSHAKEGVGAEAGGRLETEGGGRRKFKRVKLTV